VALVDKVSAAELVRRVPGQRDRREVLVELTDAGEQRLASLSTLHQSQLKVMGPAMFDALGRVLDV